MRFDYTTVGHVTVDVMVDGSHQPGGSAFYSALQAARLGLRTLIVTQGVSEEIEELLAPFRSELELEVLPARRTTTLETSGSGAARRQRLLAWAGPIDADVAIDTSILHLAPVAQETPRRWRGAADFVGLTPQGLVRRWAEKTGEISLAPLPDRTRVPEHYDAITVSEHERESCASLLTEAARAGAVVAVTAGADPTSVVLAGGGVVTVGVEAIEDPADDVGAGDVFATAFFAALADGRPADAAAAFANAAAAVRLSGLGANAIGDRSTIEARLVAAA